MTLSAEICFIDEQTEPSQTSCFQKIVILFVVNTAQGATQPVAVDVHKRQIQYWF